MNTTSPYRGPEQGFIRIDGGYGRQPYRASPRSFGSSVKQSPICGGGSIGSATASPAIIRPRMLPTTTIATTTAARTTTPARRLNTPHARYRDLIERFGSAGPSDQTLPAGSVGTQQPGSTRVCAPNHGPWIAARTNGTRTTSSSIIVTPLHHAYRAQRERDDAVALPQRRCTRCFRDCLSKE